VEKRSREIKVGKCTRMLNASIGHGINIRLEIIEKPAISVPTLSNMWRTNLYDPVHSFSSCEEWVYCCKGAWCIIPRESNASAVYLCLIQMKISGRLCLQEIGQAPWWYRTKLEVACLIVSGRNGCWHQFAQDILMLMMMRAKCRSTQRDEINIDSNCIVWAAETAAFLLCLILHCVPATCWFLWMFFMMVKL